MRERERKIHARFLQNEPYDLCDSFCNTPRIIEQFLQKDRFRKKDDEFPQKYDYYDSFPQNDPL